MAQGTKSFPKSEGPRTCAALSTPELEEQMINAERHGCFDARGCRARGLPDLGKQSVPEWQPLASWGKTKREPNVAKDANVFTCW